MTTEVANMIIEKIDRILNDNIFEGINIHYFGGEPLLNIPVLIYLDENMKGSALLWRKKHFFPEKKNQKSYLRKYPKINGHVKN